MATVVALVSQKGGVGKSTFSRGLAREAAAGGLRVKVADLDVQQGTAVEWHGIRLQAGIDPVVSVEAFATAAQALAIAGDYDLVKAGIPVERLAFALNRLGTEAEEMGARTYLMEAGYSVLAGGLYDRPAYRQAQDEGRTITETRFSSLNERADALLQSLIDRLA